MKKNIIIIVVVLLVIISGYYLFKGSSKAPVEKPVVDNTPAQTATTTQSATVVAGPIEVIGKSVEGRDITAYHYGTGTKELLFVGGLHGGYEWNTVLVAAELMDYLKANSDVVPASVKVTVIPAVNVDGLNKIVGTTTGNFTKADVATDTVPGRFNSNNVDLNRNFDCDWQTSGKWQNKTVSGGTAAFSEPESSAIQNYIVKNSPTAVVVYYSSAGGVYSSSCHNDVLPETKTLTTTYAKASGYPAFESFDFYATTGDMVNWLAKSNVPAISVLLTNHTSTEWTKNQAGVLALLKYYSK